MKSVDRASARTGHLTSLFETLNLGRRVWDKGYTNGHPRLRASGIRIILSLCYQLVLESILHGEFLLLELLTTTIQMDAYEI